MGQVSNATFAIPRVASDPLSGISALRHVSPLARLSVLATRFPQGYGSAAHLSLRTPGGRPEGDGTADDVGVSEAEVLELTQRWSDLRDREAFHLLALERAVHEVIKCSRRTQVRPSAS